jgi:DNA-binding transcriptional ArsR family regulator
LCDYANLSRIHFIISEGGLPVLKADAVNSAALEPTTEPPRRPRGRPKIEGPERVFGHPLRLRMVKALVDTSTLSFVHLRDLLGTNDGTLAAHARKLENAGYVACEKTFAGRMPRTEYRIQDQGRAALEGYLKRQVSFVTR